MLRVLLLSLANSFYLQIIVPVCYLLVENRKDVSKGGLIHICTFLLLKLSGERLFGVAINKPCSVRLPTDLPLFSGEIDETCTMEGHPNPDLPPPCTTACERS